MAPALISCSTMSVWPLLAAIPRGTPWSTFGGWEVERMQLWLNEIKTTVLRKINHMVNTDQGTCYIIIKTRRETTQ